MTDVAHETSFRIGRDPIERLVLMENHDQAYYTWHEAGAKQRILVHIDAHHDMWWVKDKALVTIANFISPALREDLVREVFWVVPDATWDTPRDRTHILTHLKKIGKEYPEGGSEMSRAVLGKALRVCRLTSLPRIDEPVLLDIDVDYLLIPRVTYGQADEHGRLPWLWPEELLARLAERGVRSDLATVAYSVEGGYTPLKWKYLGDELALRLGCPGAAGESTEGYGRMREAAEAAARGDAVVAEAKYREAADFLPRSAAPYFHSAHLYAQLGRLEEGRKAYRRVLELDKTYRTAYNSAGFVYFQSKRFKEAEQEHLRTLALDPEDTHAHFGLAQLAARKKCWEEAETLLRTSLALDANLLDSHRLLGKVLTKLGREDEAIAAYERSVKLALTGHRPIAGVLLTKNKQPRLLDPFISLVQYRLGHLYTKKRMLSDAINSYRMSTGGGNDRAAVRVRLASLYFRQGKWKHATLEVWHAVRLIPAELKWITRKFYRRVVRLWSR